jgi:hypothetical protein
MNSSTYAGGYAARHNYLAGSFPNISHRVRAAHFCPLLLPDEHGPDDQSFFFLLATGCRSKLRNEPKASHPDVPRRPDDAPLFCS